MTLANLPDQETLKELFDYDPTTGALIWKNRDTGRPSIDRAVNKRIAGREALNFLSEKGYKRGTLFGQSVRTHRVVYKWHHGSEPKEIDHRNGVRTDNRIENLRGADRRLNMSNMDCHRNGTPVGVRPYGRPPHGKRWFAGYRVGNTMITVGIFDTEEAAIAARAAALRVD
jgi:hypothetical protein